jgi:hypothetical protein
MYNLFDDVEFAKFVETRFCIRRCGKNLLVYARRILYVAKPVVNDAVALVLHGGEHSTAAVMPGDYHMFDGQYVDRELQYGKAVHVGMIYQVRDIAMHENFPWHQADDRICGDAAVRAADPQVLRVLLFRKVFKKARPSLLDVFRPAAIILE